MSDDRLASIGDAPTLTGSGEPAADPDATTLLPTAPPGYVIEGELGRGGMGVVYRARQVALNRTVALKIVLGGGHASSAARARFLAEAKAAAAIRHPGIAQVYDLGDHGGLPFFAMEFCPGGTLADKLAGTPLPPAQAAGWVAALADAVHAAHEAGIVHRDLKPANVLLSGIGYRVSGIGKDADDPRGSGISPMPDTRYPTPVPKLTDFGLAKSLAGESGVTATGAVLGSPSYMSPEQASGSRDVGVPADVYGLGAVLYECLTGRPPFRAATVLETIAQVMRDDPVPPSSLVPKLPRDLETICLKCLHKDPRRRYASAAELADELRRFLSGRPIAARPAGAAERAWKAAKRRPALAAAVGVVAVAVAAVVGVVVWKNGQLRREAAAARAAEADAAVAKASAEGRLVLALDAVERMMVRMAGESWARNPAVQAERRAVLNEAIALFRSLPEGESADPRVRRRVAATEVRIGHAHLALAEYDQAAKAFDAAAAIHEALHHESPTDAAAASELARTLVAVGHTRVLTSRFDEGLKQYERAAALARRARELEPDAPEHRLTLAEALTAIGHFNTINSAESAKYHAEVVELTRGLKGTPAVEYGATLFLATGLLNTAVAEFTRQRFPRGLELLTEAEAALRGLAGKPAPNARWADMHDSARASILGVRAPLVARTDPAAGLKMIDEALAIVESLLAVQPRTFPIRMQKLNALAARAELLQRLGRTADAAAGYAAVAALSEEIAAEAPTMGWVRHRFALARSLDLVYRVRDGDVATLDKSAAEIVASLPKDRHPEPPRNMGADVVRYNVACAFAQAARFGPPADRGAWATKAVAVLEALAKDGHFTMPAQAKLVNTDPDLKPLHGRPDFDAFLKSVRRE